MNNLLRGFILASLLLSGCAFSNDEGTESQNARLLQELAQARQDIAPLMGTWTGTLVRGSAKIDLSMTIDESRTETVRTYNGQTVYRIDPRARLISAGDNRYNAVFSGTYLKEDGSLQLVVPTVMGANQGGPDTLRSMNMKFDGTTLRGTLEANNYIVGNVVFTRQADGQSGEVPVNEEERIAEQNRRLYKDVVAKYTGRVAQNSSTRRDFNICLTVFVDDQPTETGTSVPLLRALYERMDMPTGTGVGERNLAVTYNYQVTPRRLIMTSKDIPQGYGGNNGFIVNMNLTFGTNKNGTPDYTKLTGSHLNTTIGLNGNVTLKRVTKCPARSR